MVSQGFVISNNTELPDRLRYTKEVSIFSHKAFTINSTNIQMNDKPSLHIIKLE